MWRALALCMILTACAPRASLVDAPNAADLATRDIYVATLRGLDPDTGEFGVERSTDPAFTRYAITLPPDREPGQTPYPKGRMIDTARHMLVAEEQSLTQPVQSLNAGLAAAAQPNVLLFVHGYNNTYADGILRHVQMVEDFAFKGIATHYAWPSAGHPLGYAYDRDSALFARDGLEAMIETLTHTNAEEIVITAHSVGASLTMEALRGLAIAGRQDVLNRITGVVLISPDIDVDVFRAQAARIGTLPDPFVIFTSGTDRALRLSAGITGQSARVGSLETAKPLADLDVVLIDLGEVARGGDMLRHFTAATSPLAIELIRQLPGIDAALRKDPSARAGLIPGTVIRVRQATRIVLGAD